MVDGPGGGGKPPSPVRSSTCSSSSRRCSKVSSSANADISVSRTRASHRRADTPPISRATARARLKCACKEEKRDLLRKSEQRRRIPSFFNVCSSRLVFQKTFRRVHPISASAPDFESSVNFRNAFSEIVIKVGSFRSEGSSRLRAPSSSTLSCTKYQVV